MSGRVASLVVAAAVAAGAAVLAQEPRAGTSSARESSLIDITGQWVSVITEDWRWRMITPPKGTGRPAWMRPPARALIDWP